MTDHLHRKLSAVAFWVAITIGAIAQFWIVYNGVFELRLWEDEAFNLTVPLNVARGLGYTSDGTLSGSELTMFDPRISTGPVVLLPVTALVVLGADPVVGGRLVILVFYAGLLYGLWKLGSRVGGRWAGLIAALVPLGWNTWESGSPIQSPVDILGEVPAAALLVWALICARTRPWLAGLLIGLAMQAKLLAGLAAPAVALVVFLTATSGLWGRIWRVAVCAMFAVVPNVANELWKLIVLGPDSYIRNLREFYWFFRTGGQNIEPVKPLTKLESLVSGWASPLWLTVLGIAALTILIALFLGTELRQRSTPRASERRSWTSELAALALASIAGLILWLGWWTISAHTPNWPRYPAIAMYVFASVLVAVAIGLCRRYLHEDSPRLPQRLALAGIAAALVVPIAVQTVTHVAAASHSRFGEDLAAQRAVAADIAEESENVLVSDWGPEISIIVLSGAHAGLSDVPALEEETHLIRNYGDVDEFAKRLKEHCYQVPVRSGNYALCVPKGQ